MADMRMVGQGLRRRMGAPASHIQAAGSGPMANDITAALAGMAKVGNPRMPMGQAASQASAAPVLKGKLVSKKGNSKGGNSAGFGVKNNKSAALANEHTGPRFGISVKLPGGMQESAQVQANGRIVPNVMGQRPNFNQQVDSYGVWGPQ